MRFTISNKPELDDYDYDQYGRSIDDDLSCISPSTANMYLYENNMNTFPESLEQQQQQQKPSDESDDMTSMHRFSHVFYPYFNLNSLFYQMQQSILVFNLFVIQLAKQNRKKKFFLL